MLLGMVDKDGEGGNKSCEEITRKDRARFLIDSINRYNNLAKTVKEVGNHFGRSVVTWRRMGNEDMLEWFDMAEYYERKLPRLQKNFTGTLVPRIR